MQIRRIHATFGKLHGNELSFSPGLNLIYAPNESGKSTWTHFLRTMLYGLSTRDRGAMADKNRFAPWNGSAMQGRLDFTDGETVYTVTRTTRRANSPMGEFHCTYGDTATEVPEVNAQNCGEHFLGVPREVFERSAFIAQNALAVDHNSELERRIVSLITTGLEDISYSDSYDRLKKQLNRRRANSRVGQIPALERRIEEVQQQLDTLDNLQTQAESTAQQIAQLRTRESQLLSAQAQWQAWETLQQWQAYQDAQQAAENAQNRAALLEELAAPLPSSDELSQLSGQATALQQIQHSVRQAQQAVHQTQQAADMAESHLTAHPLHPLTEVQLQEKRRALEPPVVSKTPRSVALLFILLAAACMMGSLLITALPPVVLRIAAIALLLASGGILLRHRQYRLKLAVRQEEYTQQLSSLDESSALYHALQQDVDDARQQVRQAKSAYESLLQNQQQQLLTLLGHVQTFQCAAADLSGARLAITEAQQRRNKAANARRIADAAALRADLLRERLPDISPSADAPTSQPTIDKAQLQETLSQVTATLRTAQTRMDTLTGQICASGDRDDLKAQLSRLQQELTQTQQEYDALMLAMEVLSQANTTLQNRFSPALGAKTAEIFRQLTGGHYDKVLLSRDFSLSAETPDDPTMRSIQSLSCGAADQLYLAVRLAICGMVLPREKGVPLILDDALVSFDDERLHAALDYLLQESQHRQILLFTCQKRESAYLSGRKDVTFLSL